MANFDRSLDYDISKAMDTGRDMTYALYFWRDDSPLHLWDTFGSDRQAEKEAKEIAEALKQRGYETEIRLEAA